MDVLQRDDLPFPRSLPEFQQEKRSVLPTCSMGRRLRLSAVPQSLPHRHSSRCPALSQVPPRYGPDGWHRHGTQPYAVEHMVLGGLFGRQPDARSAVQFQRQLGLSRYETAFGILHKLRAGMVRPNQDRIGGKPGEHVEIDETWGRTRGEGRGVHHKVLVACAVEVRRRKPGTAQDKRGRTLCRAL